MSFHRSSRRALLGALAVVLAATTSACWCPPGGGDPPEACADLHEPNDSQPAGYISVDDTQPVFAGCIGTDGDVDIQVVRFTDPGDWGAAMNLTCTGVGVEFTVSSSEDPGAIGQCTGMGITTAYLTDDEGFARLEIHQFGGFTAPVPYTIKLSPPLG